MSATLMLYDDARARTFEPFALTRPVGELRSGAELIRRRWERCAGSRAGAFVGAAHLAAFDEDDAPRAATAAIPAGTILANSRFAPALDSTLGAASVWRAGGRVAAVRLLQPLELSRLEGGAFELETVANGTAADLGGWWIDEIWDIVGMLPEMLRADIAVLGATEPDAAPGHLSVLGEHEVFVARGAYIEPYVLADTTAGPVLVRQGARVCAFTRLVGPCVIGTGTIVSSGRVATCSIGDHVRVQGDISNTVMIGHANKGHEGFVGHSVIGRWANLGAGTTTSNLKNSYGDISLWTPDGVRRTGLQFLGAMIGDHVKTGIGMRLTTGTVIGACANVFGNAMPPKFVPPFAWGDTAPFGVFEFEKFLEVAERAMKRRDVVLTDGGRRALAAAWARRGIFRA